MFENVVIGKPLVEAKTLIAYDDEDWIKYEKPNTLFTNSRNLAQVLKEAGVVPSVNEVRRNKPELNITLDKLDCLWVKWGKKRVWIVVGE